MMRWIFKCTLFALIFHGVYKFCYHQTAGFSIARITSYLDFHQEWEIHDLDKDILQMDALSQTFSFLGHGGQCFAFVSEDQQYVLKLYKHDIRRLPFLIEHLPLPKKYALQREQQREKRFKRLLRDFNSFKIAYENIKEETGLLYIHLNPTNDIHRKITITDKLHIAHTIDLDKTTFILQKKADMAYPYLHHLLEEQDVEKSKEAVNSICALILARSKKGIYDEDAKIHRNFGFIDNRAILVDVGRLKLDERRKIPSVQKEDLHKITEPFEKWLYGENPELAQSLSNSLKSIYESLESL